MMRIGYESAPCMSVILPMYNSENTIERALASVINQTRLDYIKEILVIDDGSSDSSARLVKEFSDKYEYPPIRYFHKPNGGVSSARNLGISKAEGSIIGFLDSDDCWLPHKTERQMEILREHPDIVFLGGAYEDRPLRIGWKTIKSLHNGSIKELCFKNFPVTPSIIIKKFAIDQIGGFDETQRYAEDINYFQKFCIQYNYYYLPEKLVEIGIQKDFFSQSGLSSNLKEMHLGTIKNLNELRRNYTLNIVEYHFFRVFYFLKYLRRIIVRRFRLRGVRFANV